MESAFSLSAFFEAFFSPLFFCDARPATFQEYAYTLVGDFGQPSNTSWPPRA